MVCNNEQLSIIFHLTKKHRRIIMTTWKYFELKAHNHSNNNLMSQMRHVKLLVLER